MVIKNSRGTRPQHDYPAVERDGFAQMVRRRWDANLRDAKMTREIALSRKTDQAGMDDLIKRLGHWGRSSKDLH